MSPVLILGAAGYVGHAFAAFFENAGVPAIPLARARCDYTRPEPLAELLAHARPCFVVNCAGFTGKPNVDACEQHKADCLAANAVLPGTISKACREAGVPWGHVSSGCIYQGTRPDGSGFRETDPPNFSFRHPPCSFYSGTKALGEEILADDPTCFVWRMRIPFDGRHHGRNYLAKLLTYPKLLDARNSITGLDEFPRACWQLVANNAPPGIYNMTNPGAVTTREIVGLLGQHGLKRHFEFFDSEEEFHRVAARSPRSSCVLDTAKAAAHGARFSPVHDALLTAIAQLRTHPDPPKTPPRP